MERWHYEIKGRVQGVGYRAGVIDFIRCSVPELKGYVKNTPDGNVEVEAQGELEDLEQLEIYCQKGPGLSFVDEVVVDKSEELKDDFRDFRIVFD